MMMLVLAVCFIVSAISTHYLIGYANQHQLLDIPNARSSHSIPTPTGGGMAIVVTFMGFLLLAALTIEAAPNEVYWLVLTGTVLAVVGYIDDHRHIPAQWRLLIHFVVAFALLSSLTSLPSLTVFGWQWQSGWLLSAIYLVAMVWLLNLFNFMDGIDGIASIEAVTTLCSAAMILYVSGDIAWPLILLSLSACVSGFLLFNWPPAKIFMGDAGSGFLGFMLGALAIITAQTTHISLWSWMILLAIFIGDATVTLLTRAKRGQKIHQAHRSHAYQILSRKWGSHLKVTLSVLLVNLLWLLPLALFATLWPGAGLLLCFLAYAPLLWVIIRNEAGITI
jgi:Fuc2NAc and GlcNAc transferase